MNSDQNAVPTEAATPTELDTLKEEATRMGITFSPNIGLKTLQEKIDGFIPPLPVERPVVDHSNTPAHNNLKVVKTMSPMEKRNVIVKEATKLIRVRVTCMNPNKSEWEGEIFTVSNSVIPTQKKFVPFNNEDGWHVPQIILNMIKERKCQVFKTVKGPRGNKIRKGYTIPEFSVDILDPLTVSQMADLAKKQAIANNQD